MNYNYHNLNDKIAYITNCEYKYFLSKENVIGVGLGYKIKNGFYTCMKCIVVFVTKKLPLDRISACNLVPNIYKGVPTDVIESDIPKTASLTTRKRPVTGGYCIGVKGLKTATMGCLVGNSHSDYILTSNHAIINNKREKLKAVVFQPSPEYGGKESEDIIGKVVTFTRVLPQSQINDSDAALVLTDRIKSSIDITFIGPIRGTSDGRVGQKVQKVGCISGLTTGNITTINTTIMINYLGEEVLFKNQIVTTKMSVDGDSGSVLLNNNKEAIGLLMANSKSNTVYNDINIVLTKLYVHILRR
ncbi:trypsin-like serine protease [Clostridium botulinum]|uniref:Peptidase S1 domain-containing protein n=1 Tax=Clostridium botulinum D str. 1873 TaxID=592027 RepID=A0A9P2G6K7_CLOBO|nr:MULTISPECIES: trypsin-like serine protease [Clostridium]AYF53605.1 serine protease [Clostridium novyi]EES90897.1 conserved hypothetical protein [Clostridium botulinum D str. 1873]MBO3441560.1 trypsin-like serine protease [Clostridium haemolyticum]MCD3218165.1 trypsin-like serine protease [Clostridium botulinum C]MCD3244938.1 trypsin-like serine protease [Clostridium botulinum C]